MALKKIFWSQINSELIPTNDPVNFGSSVGYINDIYTTDLWINGINIADYINNQSIWQWDESGSYYSTTNDLQVTGSMTIKGNLLVEGTTTLRQTDNIDDESLIVSGVMSVVRNEINEQIASASLSVGTFAIREESTLGTENEIIDLGLF